MLALACAAPASADVTGQSANGFATAGTVTIAAAPDRVWAGLVQPGRWWDSEHSWSGNAANLTLDPRAGGCFCEALADGGSVEHMRVIYADPARQLRLSGALGPLQGEALAATLSIKLEKAGEGTRLSWSYKVGGYTDLPIAQIAPAVDGVVSAQFVRLRHLVETGAPQAK
ncbi:MAG: SRPBCC family protein [Croceibacterium sp.]